MVVLAGPSGVGKGTIVRKLLERDSNLWFSVSANTRAPRPNEVEGQDYLFMSRPEFEQLRDRGGFLEWFDVYGDLKGTPRRPVEEHLAAGDDVLLEIDVQGALAVKQAFPAAVLLFIASPNRDEQRRRLEGRHTDDPATIERRLAKAAEEETLADQFDAVVVNRDLETAVDQVAAILKAHRAA